MTANHVESSVWLNSYYSHMYDLHEYIRFMPSASLSPTKPSVQRLPAPSLFVGPPSRNASNTSLSPTTTNASSTRNASFLQRSIQDRSRSTADVLQLKAAKGRSPAAADRQNNSNATSQSNPHRSAAKRLSSSSLEIRWAEMQSTLDEVEAKAERGPHIFGAAHSDALSALQGAHVALAQSWAKSEQEEVAQGPRDTSESDTTRPRAETTDSVKNALEEETENDILLARRRREANDRYFQRVNDSVRDAISKLDGVAKAMKEVERESKDLWEDGDSIDTTSISN